MVIIDDVETSMSTYYLLFVILFHVMNDLIAIIMAIVEIRTVLEIVIL